MHVTLYSHFSPVKFFSGVLYINKLALQFDEHRMKLIMVGDSFVGKTSLALQFTNDFFPHNTKQTITDITTRQINIDGEDVVFQIWDTAGQERYRSLLPLYLRGVHGALLVYDVTKWHSFANIETWINEVRKSVSGNPVMALIGNKSDLINYKCVTTQDGGNLASDYGMIFIETSAKTGHNVHQAFIEVGKEILKRNKEYSTSMDFKDSLKVGSDNKISRQRGCCS